MKNTVSVNWLDDLAFEARVNDFSIILDAEPGEGGPGRGPRPKQLTLAALGGCTGMDVISILKKMKVECEAFRVEVSGELTEEHPKYYHTILVRYIFRGKDLPLEKIEKAISLSRERYCGVSAMLSKAAVITDEIVFE